MRLEARMKVLAKTRLVLCGWTSDDKNQRKKISLKSHQICTQKKSHLVMFSLVSSTTENRWVMRFEVCKCSVAEIKAWNLDLGSILTLAILLWSSLKRRGGCYFSTSTWFSPLLVCLKWKASSNILNQHSTYDDEIMRMKLPNFLQVFL